MKKNKLTWDDVARLFKCLDPDHSDYPQQLDAVSYVAKLVADEDEWSANHAYQLVDGWSRRAFSANIRQTAAKIVG